MHPPDPFAHRYTKLRLVGRGGFGTVYRASDTEMEREVALKLLNPDLAADPDWRRRFRQEATAASKLNHPNITIVFDRGEYQDQPFIVMEFVEGETLSKTIEHGLALTDPERIVLLEQLCDGLHYAHQRDIVHRDIKPVNLIVREDDDGTYKARTLKILDFGIAKVVDSGHTATGSMMFTPNYVSPEQVLGEEVDRRGDIFAVGAVAYELLVLQKAFVISSKNPFTILEEVKRKIVEEPHRPMTSVRQDIDPELSAIIDRALAKSPADRYRDLAEMRRRLRTVRERLEESTAATSEATIIVAPKTQAVMRLARQALEAGDATAAVAHLQQATAAVTNEIDRRALAGPLRQALERQAAIRAERKAHDEAAARAAISMATAAFIEGDRTSALRALGQFEPPDLVAQELALFARAAAAITAAERAIEGGDADARDAALDQLQSLDPGDLIEPALARLRNRADQRSAAEQRAAEAAIAQAREDFVAGRRDEAIAALEGFTPPALVGQALSELRDGRARIDHAARAVMEGGDEERQRALTVLEAFWPAQLVAGALLDLRARAAERRAAEHRAEEEAAAAREAAAAVELFVTGSREQAIARLAEFSNPLKVAATLKRLSEAAGAIDSADVAVREGGRDDRARALARLEGFGDSDLVTAPLKTLRSLDASRRRAEDHHASAADAVRRARALFDGGERTAAIEDLETFDPPHRDVREAIDELRARAAQLDESEQAIRDAQERSRWADAAQDTIRLARDAFAQGRRTDAVNMLQGFARPDLIAPALSELRQLGALVDAAAERVATRPAEERRVALEELAAAQPGALVAGVLAELRRVDAGRTADEQRLGEEARAREELAGRVRAAQNEAHRVFAEGRRDHAIELLEGFRPTEPVAEALDGLRTAVAGIDAARASLTAAGVPAPVRRAALERLARLEPRDLYASALAELRSVDDKRTAAEARAEAERRQQEEQANLARLKTEAQEAVTAATAQFVGGAYEAGISTLASFQPPDLVAEALALLRRAKAVIDKTNQAFGDGDASGRVRLIDQLLAFQPKDLVNRAAAALRTEHLRRSADEQQAAMAKQARDRAERSAAEARRRFEAGDAGGALTLLEGEPAHELVTASLDELRLDLRTQELTGRAQDHLRAGRLSEAAASVRQAQALRPEDQRVRALAREIGARRRTAQAAGVRRVATRYVAPALAAGLLVFGAYKLLPTRDPASGTGTGTPPTTVTVAPKAPGTEGQATPGPVALVPTSVTIDAIPWARFKITPVAANSKQAVVTGETPVKLELLPGDYVVELENGNLTQPLTQRISVLNAPFTRAFQMPGFAADRAVTALLGPKR